MKEEIKDILELLRDGVKRPVVTLSKYSLDNICELNPNECKKLLEYIENLQSQLKAKEEENKQLKADYGNQVQTERDMLQQENQELKKENKILRENSEHNDKVVDKVNWENQLLKKQLEEYKNELEKADSITQSCIFNGKKESEISYRKCLNMLEKNKNQQKEFIEYMNKTIEELECDDVGDEEIKGYLIQRIDTFKEILSKYKEIIGGKELTY